MQTSWKCHGRQRGEEVRRSEAGGTPVFLSQRPGGWSAVDGEE